jgi:tryptophan synthase alpha chain
MNRYEKLFNDLQKKQEGAFIPFVVLNDPDKNLNKEIITALIQSGADALELGIAFSDPLADGPTIQKAGLRALKNKSSVAFALSLIKEIREENPDIPIGILTYANLVIRKSASWFYGSCKEAGVDSVLVADIPLREIKPFHEEALKHHIAPVLIAPPNLPLSRCADIAALGQGYTYVVTRAGVTGANEKINLAHHDLVKNLKAHKAAPLIFGFGISAPEHVKQALREGADGVVSGSKIVSIIEENLADKTRMLEEIKAFCESMKKATIGL